MRQIPYRINRKSQLAVTLLRWYRKNGRSLPWRNERDSYRILVSEVMLQQTQVSRVMIKYPLFLRRFPSMKRLAHARASDVIKAWQGMGYNSRALRLQKLAAIVVNNLGGKLPKGIAELEALPGIGRYTAHAMASFAFGQRVPVVDTNMRRVLTRLHSMRRGRTLADETEIWMLAESLLPQRRSHVWNQALMDLGSTICTSANPRCDICPLAELCPSAHAVQRRIRAVIRVEPGRDGVPNRIYRGRIIQALGQLKTDESIGQTALAGKIKSDFEPADRRWFEALLKGLEKDGLIRLRSRATISLPD